MQLFDDVPVISPRTTRRGYMAQIPDLGWRRITEYPMHFINAARIAYDVEARETDFEHGAGWARGCGYACGVSVAAEFHDGHIEAVYLPFAHDVQREYNLPLEDVKSFLRYVLETNIPKVGANIYYDYGWMAENGIKPKGKHYCIQYAEALLTDGGRVALEYLGQKYLGRGKETDAMYDWIAATYPQTPVAKLRQHIWQTPVSLVAFYAEQDSVMPLEIFKKQWQLLYENQLIPVYEMECGLIPLLVEMRFAGVTVDMDKTVQLRERLTKEIQAEQLEINRQAGFDVSANNKGDTLAQFCDKLGVKYPKTATGKASFKDDWLDNQDHVALQKIRDIRKREKVVGTFIDGYLIGSSVNNKIHCSFHPLKGSDGGTKTGRFSSSDPNLQNIPSRTELGKELRTLFIPDSQHETMWVGDYSQIEYLNLAHFAVGAGADDVRAQYRNDPKTDYHDLVQAMVERLTGIYIKRAYIKNINFGLLYGMSPAKLAIMLGLSMKEVKPLFEAYHNAAPYVMATMNAAAEEARHFGYVRTIMGRKSYFELYEPLQYDAGAMPLPYELALQQYGHAITRAGLYKAINYKLQGSAADCMKKAMLDGYNAGIFDVTGVPRLTVHDELVFSIAEKTKIVDEALREFVNIAQTCLPYTVPIRFEADYGCSWAEAKG